MPIYDFLCRQGHLSRNLLGQAGVEHGPVCSTCAGETRKVWTKPPASFMDYPPYECPVTGKWIEGRKAHEENLKRTNCHICEAGETDHAERAQAKFHEEAWDANEALVDKVFGELASN